MKVVMVKGGSNTVNDIAGGAKNQVDPVVDKKTLTTRGCFSIQKHHDEEIDHADDKRVVVARQEWCEGRSALGYGICHT
ncbi:MAG TPA: hypothetical protein PKJ72_10515 [Deltaproteobacteria bacterium]|jgi:hypothetical protein|nr:hypothetical protein [Deltaproteobacteria bacterium]HNS90473.1 hypothetical protein [Deltaproteobacteria bacterium]HOY75452.1 hypothetical protein [Deltaproteobacteria bacterium]HPH51074.1 hypothetical protein [Deltaproteobacteria bacterium]HPO32072.1 hypothetical protein [Deltaproteobacteria bacterium]